MVQGWHKLGKCGDKAVIDKTRLYYGAFEEILSSYMVPSMSHIEFAHTLILAPWDEVPEGLSDKISDPFVSNLRSGRLGLTKKMLEPYTQKAHNNVKKCIKENILSRIHDSEDDKLREEVLNLIQTDSTLSAELKADLEDVARTEELAFFLADAYLLAAKCSVAQKSAKKKTAPRQKQEAVSNIEISDAAGGPSFALAPAAPRQGDNGGGRRIYTVDEYNALCALGILSEKIVFNSICDSTIGDERDFVAAREYIGLNVTNIQHMWTHGRITVKNGQEYIIRLYVHNNNANGIFGVSHNTRVAFDVPEESSTQILVYGYIFSDNATPTQYWDSIMFTSDRTFHLDYIFGKALIENYGYASKERGGGKKLSDEIVTKAASKHGVRIGYAEADDGEIPGGYQYTCYVTIHVRAVFD